MLRIFKAILTYLIAATLLLIITVGLINTYMGVDSPVRELSARALSMLPPLPMQLNDQLPKDWLGGGAEPPQGLTLSSGRGMWHQSIDEVKRICTAPEVSEVPIWSERKAYAWVNEDGVRSFGDEAPTSLPKQVFGMDKGDREFASKLIWENLPPKRALEGKLRGAATRINEQWGIWIGREALVRTQVTLRITSNRTQFIRDWGGPPDGPTPSGFYSLKYNEAVAFYDPTNMTDERLLGVMFHEVAHLVTTWQVGLLPPWYSEGLAEYFESMQVQWQSASYRSREAWHDRVTRSGLMGLDNLLKLTASDWFMDDIQKRYSTAGALIAFLMSTDRGRELLTSLAQDAHKERCASRSSKNNLGLDAYPGGLTGLERELRSWLQ